MLKYNEAGQGLMPMAHIVFNGWLVSLPLVYCASADHRLLAFEMDCHCL